MIQHHIPTSPDAAAGMTYAAGAMTTVFWGLHVSDICMILSTLATLMGVLLQVFLATKRIHRLEHKAERTEKVIVAVAKGQRAQREKSNDNSERIAAIEADDTGDK